MNDSGGSSGLGNFIALSFGILCLLAVWTGYKALRHQPTPTISTSYEQNAVPMSYTDQCGEDPVCVWWWAYDETEAPGWRLFYGPDFPPGAEPVRSFPVLAVGP